MGNVKSKEYQNEYQQEDETTIEIGDKYPYLQIDLNRDPEKIAQEMVEDYNYPGTTKPMPFDSSSLPEGWQKSVIRRTCADFRWEVLISHTAEGAKRGYFHKKSQIDNYLKRNKLPYDIDMFVFCLDDQLKKLKQIWTKYIVKKPTFYSKNRVASLKEHVQMNPIPQVKQEIFSPNENSKSITNKKISNAYSCADCRKTFCTPSKLERHKMSHTGVKPFSCDICFKSFNQKIHLQNHMRTVHLIKPNEFENFNFSPNKNSKKSLTKLKNLQDHVKMNPIPFLKKELISPKKNETSDDVSNNDQNMLQLKNLGVYDNYMQLANENEENNEYLNVDSEITPNKSKKRAMEKSDSDSGIDEAKRLKTEKMWDEMMFNDDWTLNQDDSTGQLISE